MISRVKKKIKRTLLLLLLLPYLLLLILMPLLLMPRSFVEPVVLVNGGVGRVVVEATLQKKKEESCGKFRSVKK